MLKGVRVVRVWSTPQTTTLKAIYANLLHAERGEVAKGTIEFDGKRVEPLDAERARANGRVPGDGRARPRCFQHLTVEEDL